MGGADLIAGQPVGLKVSGALVELPAIPKRDTVHDQVAVQMVGVDVGGHQHLKVGELPLASSRPMAWASWGVRSSCDPKD